MLILDMLNSHQEIYCWPWVPGAHLGIDTLTKSYRGNILKETYFDHKVCYHYKKVYDRNIICFSL